MSTSTLGALITAITADTVSLGAVAISAVTGIAVALMILGFFWSRLKRRAVHAKGF